MPATKAAESEPTPDMVNMPNIRQSRKYETGEKPPFGAAAAIAAHFALRQPRGQPPTQSFRRIRSVAHQANNPSRMVNVRSHFSPKRGHG